MSQHADRDLPPTRVPQRQYVGLLTQLTTNTLDEDYRAVADARAAEARGSDAPRRPGRRSPVALVAVLVAFGAMVGVSALKTEHDRPQLEAEREQLVAEIHQRQDDLEGLHERSAELSEEVSTLRERLITHTTTGRAAARQIDTLGVASGTVPVSGPGLVVTTDNAPGTSGVGGGGVILDRDLQMLVNGLWEAGAEAIAIDGHRLSTLTAIRFAGQAITVDYRSLTPPYEIEVIGDPDTLQSRLLETEGGQMWLGLEANFGITFDMADQDRLTLPGDPHDHLNYATPAGDR